MWYDTWLDTFRGGLETVRVHLPSIGVAVLLVLLGWVLARLGRRAGRSLVRRLLDRAASTSASLGRAVDGSGARATAPAIVGWFAFWLILLVFVAAAVETLGLPVMTDLLGRLATYAPNILAAGLVMLAGVITARIVRSAVLRAAEAGGIGQAPAVAAAAEGIVLLLAGVIALEQLGIDGRVLELTVAVVVGSLLAAVALAFGLGARSSVANLIAARYVARMVHVGQRVVIDENQGTVVELTPTAVVLDTGSSRVVVPAQRFHDTTTVILPEEN